MGENSAIQWTNHTFNPWVGCQRVSPGCEHCYAESYDKRVGGAWVEVDEGRNRVKKLRWGPKGPRVRTSPANWRKPLKWHADAVAAGMRRRVFCASLADVFEQLRPGQVGQLDVWRLELFDLIARTPQLDWLLLTKRPELIEQGIQGAIDAYPRTPGGLAGLELAERWYERPPPNVWLGSTVEDQQRANERIPELLKVPAVVRFLSCEPLLEPVLLTRWLMPHGAMLRGPTTGPGINWVIIGGESGGGARPFNVSWARSLVRQARQAGAAPFVKQLGANVRTRNDDSLISDFTEGGWDLDPEQVEEHVHGFREDHQGAEVRVRLRDAAGGDANEWPADLRVREFPVGAEPRCVATAP